MVKKGILEEIFSKAKFSNDPSIYKVVYRDFEHHREISLPDFILESNNFESIPTSRIKMVKRRSRIIFHRRVVRE